MPLFSDEKKKKAQEEKERNAAAVEAYYKQIEYERSQPSYSQSDVKNLQNQYAQLRKDFGGNWDKDAMSSTSNSILGSIQSLRKQNEKRGRFKDRELENYLNGLEDYVGYVGEMTSAFDKRTDYNKAVRQSGYHDKYEGLSRDELRDVTHQLIQSNGGKKNEEVDWLLGYMNSDEVLTADDLKKMSLQEQRRADTLASSAANKYRLSSGENADKYAWMSEYGVDPGQVISTDAYTQLLRSQGAAQQANSLASQYRTGAYWKEQQEKYGNLSNSADFTRLSQYDPGIGGTYDLVMRPDKAVRVNTQDQILPSSGVLNPETLSYMSDEDRAKFSYLWRSQGEKAAMEFLNNSARYANSAAQMADIRAANKALGGNWVTGIPASIGSVPINLMSGTGFIDAAIQNARNRANPDEYRPVDYNSPGFMANAVSSSIREGGTERWNSVSGTINIDANKNPRLAKIFNGKGLGDAYQLTMSMADSGAIAALGGGFGTVLLGGSAATQGILDAVERGATDGQALTMGFLNGAFETAFEYMSIEHLLNKLSFKKAWQQIASQAFAEGSEEFNTTLFNTMADILVMAQNSEYMQNAQDYIDQGKTPEEAQKQALADFVVQLAWDAIGGAISGGVMGAGHFGFERITQNAEYKQLYNDGVTLQALVNEALELDSGNELANKLKGRDSARGGQIRRLVEQNDQAIQAQDRQAIQSAAENRLREVGETENVAAVAAAVTKSVTGENLAKSDRAALQSSRYGQLVINELRDTTGEYTSDWTGSIGTEQINVGQYNRDAFMREDIADVLTNGPMGLDDATARAAVRSAMNETLTAEEQALIGGEDAKAAVELARAFSESPDQLQTYRMLRSTTDSNGLTEGMRRAIRTQENAPKRVTQTETQKAEQAQTAGRTAKSIATGRLSTTTNSLGMQSLLNMRNETQDDVLYENGVRRAYEMAQAGISYEDIARSTLVSELTDAQLRAVYSEGRNNPVKVERPQGRSSAARGTVRAQGTSLKELRATFNDAQKTAYNLLSSIAEATGLNIVLYKSGGTGAQGMFKASDNNTVYVDVDAGLNVGDDITDMAKYTMLRTFTHEFTHFIERWSSDAYNELREVVFSHMDNAEERVDSWMLRMAEDKSIPSDQRYDRATREVVAEGLVDILPETQFIQDLYENHRNIFQKLWDQLKSFLADIKAHFAGMGDTTPEARALKQQVGDTVKYFDDIVKAFDKAAKSAVENMNAAGVAVDEKTDSGDVVYQDRLSDVVLTEDDISRNTQDLAKMSPVYTVDESKLKKTGELPSDIFQSYFDKWGNILKSSVLGDISVKNSSVRSEIRHGLTKEKIASIEAIPEAVDKGKIIFAEQKKTGGAARIVVAAPINIGSTPYYMGVMLQRDSSNQRLYLHDLILEKEESISSKADLLTTGANEKDERLFMTNILAKALSVKYQNSDKTKSAVQYQSRVTPEQDAEYLELAKDPEGNKARLQEMVEQAARAAGYDMRMWHGAKNGKKFTVFKGWSYFTEDRSYAEKYTNRKTENLYGLYVKIEHLFDTRTDPAAKQDFANAKDEYGMSEIGDRGLPDWTDGYDICDYIEENGLDYDAVILDEGAQFDPNGKTYDDRFKRVFSYVIKDSAQVKSADPVTYDDSGNVIPLSERFNSENEDIRYQARKKVTDLDIPWDPDNHSTLKQQMLRAQDSLNKMSPVTSVTYDKAKDNYAKMLNDVLRTRFGYKIDRQDMDGTFLFDQTAVDIMRHYIRTDAEAAAAIAAPYVLKRGEIISGHKNHKDGPYPSVTFGAPVMLNGERGNVVVAVLFADKDRVHSLRVLTPDGREFVLTQMSKADSEREDSTTKAAAITPTESASADKISQPEAEVNTQDTEQRQERTATITNRDLLVNALDTVVGTEQKKILDEYRKKVTELNGKAQQLADIRKEIHDTMFTKGADRSKLTELNNRAAILQTQIDRADKSLTKIEAMEPIKRLLESERNKARKAQAEKGRERLATYRESRSKTEMRQNIRKVVDDFARRMDKPTERRYIPREFMPAVIELMEAIDTTTPRTLKDGTVREMSQTAEAKANALNTLYDRLQNDDTFKVAYDPVVHDMVRKMVDVIGNTPVNDMSMEQLRTVYDTLRAVRKTISEATKLKDSQFKQNAFEVGRNLIRETRSADHVITAEWLAGYVNTQLSPDRFFERMAGFAKDSDWAKVGAMFSEGTKKSLGIQRDFYYFFRDLTENKKFDELTKFGKKHLVDIGLVDAEGNSIPITRGMMLSVFMHLQNADNVRGVLYGGLSVPVFNTYYAGKVTAAYGKGKIKARVGSAMTELWNTAHELRELGKDYDTAANDDERAQIQARMEELQQKCDELEAQGQSDLNMIRSRIENTMTEYEQELVKRAHEWYDGKSRQYINDTTMAIYGIKKAGVDNYYSIHRDTDYLASDFESISRNLNLENSGFLKERVPSEKPILLTDICYEMDSHVQNLSKYVGYVNAQRNFNKIYKTNVNGKTEIDSVKAAVGALGKKNGVVVRSAQDYIERYIGDIVGGKTEPHLLGTFRGYVARGSLTLNLKVAFSQAASIPTAAAEVGWGSMARGFIKSLPTAFSGKAHQELARKSVYFWQRYRGEGGMREFAEAKGSGNRIDRIWNWAAKTKVGRRLLNWCQDVDVWSTYTMWAMAEDWIQHNTDMKPGTEEYDAAVEKKYDDIIRKTQPNYTTTERSDMLRNKNELFKTFTMFKTQPNQNFNILYEAAAQARRYRRDYKYGKNGVTQEDVKTANIKLANAYTAVLIGAPIAYVGLRFIANLLLQNLKAYRDDDDELTAESIARGMAMEYASSIAGNMLYGGQIYEFVEPIMTGGKYNGPSDSALALLGNFADQTFVMTQKALDPEKKISVSDWEKMVQRTSSAWGIPYSNAKKIYKGVGYWIEDAQDDTLFKFEASAERTNSVQYNRLFKALDDNEKYSTIYDELRQTLVVGGKTEEEADSLIRSGVKKRAKEMFTGGELTEQNAIDMLAGHQVFGMDADEAYWAVQEWKYDLTKSEDDPDFSKYGKLYDAIKSGQGADAAYKTMLDHGYTEDRISTQVRSKAKEWYENGEITEQQAKTILAKYTNTSDVDATVGGWSFTVRYGVSYDDRKQAYYDGTITRSQLVDAMVEKGKSAEEAETEATLYDWQRMGYDGDEVYDINRYKELAEPTGMPVNIYIDFCNNIRNVDGYNQADKLPLIDELPLTTAQKDALWFCCGWAESTLYKKAPWH